MKSYLFAAMMALTVAAQTARADLTADLQAAIDNAKVHKNLALGMIPATLAAQNSLNDGIGDAWDALDAAIAAGMSPSAASSVEWFIYAAIADLNDGNTQMGNALTHLNLGDDDLWWAENATWKSTPTRIAYANDATDHYIDAQVAYGTGQGAQKDFADGQLDLVAANALIDAFYE